MPKPVLQVPLIEVANHVLSLVLAIVDLLNSVEDHHENNLVRHYSCLLVEVFVALLNSLYRRLQHVLWLTVDAYTYGQPNLTFT